MNKDSAKIPTEYLVWLTGLKKKIITARQQAALSLNKTLIELYWNLGQEIMQKEKTANWGSKFIDRLSRDLTQEFPDIKGFSRRNLYAIRQWYLFYSPKYSIVPQAVAQIPWGHNRLILNKIRDVDEAIWYASSTIESNWSRDNLELQIEKQLFQRKGKTISNFSRTLPAPQSELALETIKDPYNFDFLGLDETALEKNIEKRLIDRITEFLLELGKGFAFVGRQYKIEVSNNEYAIDLLFYHLDLRCYIVIELKAGKFKPEHAGKLNFYLSAVDSQVKDQQDNPTIGILLCKSKDKIEAEYSLRDIHKPIGISSYELTHSVPEKLTDKLPSIVELEDELAARLVDKCPDCGSQDIEQIDELSDGKGDWMLEGEMADYQVKTWGTYHCLKCGKEFTYNK